MKIQISNPKVQHAIDIVRKFKKPDQRLDEAFEKYYHCKIETDNQVDPWCLDGWIIISEEKYQTLFLLQNGFKNNE